ncbi:YlxQ family RNA-binding protein [Sediminibacillus dalangtanensis]|uniref:YlxQ family RNA-binding protein n=1 Tax=Sediminibacillus dalangtanensis TaxID=2729421 RepID=A0ABX7VRA3_9BACI|nr:YlxQ family RNA-binding protein [Sediminibacillus dalangtanensis]QTM99452.1 YlxQ family RNA-binding protein [Sediminibacillus dalangtanensis]
MSKDYLNLLGLAFRAGKLTLGEEAIIRDIQKRKAKLVLLASDTGAQTRKKITDKCTYYQIPFFVVDDRETISQAIGKSGRVAVAILDSGFAAKMTSLLDESIRG